MRPVCNIFFCGPPLFLSADKADVGRGEPLDLGDLEPVPKKYIKNNTIMDISGPILRANG
jgi:hypothetical protein